MADSGCWGCCWPAKQPPPTVWLCSPGVGMLGKAWVGSGGVDSLPVVGPGVREGCCVACVPSELYLEPVVVTTRFPVHITDHLGCGGSWDVRGQAKNALLVAACFHLFPPRVFGFLCLITRALLVVGAHHPIRLSPQLLPPNMSQTQDSGTPEQAQRRF